MIERSADVLVIGAGGAGLRAALAARERGASVLLMCKGKLGKAGVTATACSDRMAFHATLPHTPPGGTDSWRHHAEDIYRLGGFVSDADLAEVLAKNAADAFDYLDSLGVPFAKDAQGRASQFLTDGSRYPRACFTGPYTANHIEEALVRRLRETDIALLEDMTAVDLILDDGRACGVLAIDPSGKPAVVGAGAVVLATGGAGEMYSVNVFPPGMTGDGYAMALRAGAELVNMEFIQIGLSSVKTKLACSGSMMRAIPRFVNEGGEEILPRYMPEATPDHLADIVFRKGASWPVSLEHDTHAVDVAVFKEEMIAGSRVFLDYSRNPSGLDPEKLGRDLMRRYAEIGAELMDEPGVTPLQRILGINKQAVQWLKERGVDIPGGDAVEIAPAIQHFQGGIKIRQRADTVVEGLFAAGEAAGGQHGANRPGGNALLDSQVFGKIAGESAADAAAKAKVIVDSLAGEAEKSPSRRWSKGVAASSARDTVRNLMSRYAGIVRTEDGLGKACARLDELSERGIAVEGGALQEAAEAENMLLVARSVIKGALLRDESRGPHLRFESEDDGKPVPRQEDKWSRYIAISSRGGDIVAETREPIRPTW